MIKVGSVKFNSVKEYRYFKFFMWKERVLWMLFKSYSIGDLEEVLFE